MDKINELIDALYKAAFEHGRACGNMNGDARETVLRYAEARDALYQEIDRTIRGTGCIDKTGREIMEGQIVRYNNAGKHVKEDYWNPIYRVVWNTPGFDLVHCGGGKPTDMDTRFLIQHRQDLLEIIGGNGEPVDEPEPIAAPAEALPSSHVNRGAWRAITSEEWRDLGGKSNPLCDWHEGIGYVVYDAEALERFHASVEEVNSDRRAVKELMETDPDPAPADPPRMYEKGTVFGEIEDLMTGSQAALDVISERARQVSDESYLPERDDQHVGEELASAAMAYISEIGRWWPRDWRPDMFKPTNRRRNLVKAAALLIAEIERLDRAEGGAK